VAKEFSPQRQLWTRPCHFPPESHGVAIEFSPQRQLWDTAPTIPPQEPRSGDRTSSSPAVGHCPATSGEPRSGERIFSSPAMGHGPATSGEPRSGDRTFSSPAVGHCPATSSEPRSGKRTSLTAVRTRTPHELGSFPVVTGESSPPRKAAVDSHLPILGNETPTIFSSSSIESWPETVPRPGCCRCNDQVLQALSQPLHRPPRGICFADTMIQIVGPGFQQQRSLYHGVYKQGVGPHDGQPLSGRIVSSVRDSRCCRGEANVYNHQSRLCADERANKGQKIRFHHSTHGTSRAGRLDLQVLAPQPELALYPRWRDLSRLSALRGPASLCSVQLANCWRLLQGHDLNRGTQTAR
jgi:hypothetical protein